MTAPKHLSEHKPSGRRPWRTFTPEQVATMAELWNSGRSQTYIARQFDTHQVVVSRVLRAAGIESGPGRSGNRKGSESWAWKGGRTVTEGGYIAIWAPPDHQFASMRNRTGYILEHRLVVAQRLGRPLISRETVHHINGDRQDNRDENLQLRQGRHGKGQVSICLNCGSTNVGSVPIAEIKT